VSEIPFAFIQNVRAAFQVWLDGEALELAGLACPQQPEIVSQEAIDSLIGTTLKTYEDEQRLPHENDIPLEQDFFGRIKCVTESLLTFNGKQVEYNRASCEQVDGNLEILRDEDKLRFSRSDKGCSAFLMPGQKQRFKESEMATRRGVAVTMDSSDHHATAAQQLYTMPTESHPAGNEPYTPALWEKIVAFSIAGIVVLFILLLSLRDKPFPDPNIVVMLRIILSLAVAVLGAIVPGFLHIGWNKGGFALRAGGALALFVLALFCTPTVLPAPSTNGTAQATYSSVTHNTSEKSDSAQTTATQSVVKFEQIDPLPQAVNRKFHEDGSKPETEQKERKEIATFRFRVFNSGRASITVLGAELLVDKSRSEHYSSQTVLFCPPIDHNGHISVPLEKPHVGDVILVPLRIVIQADSPSEFTLWFTSPDAAQRREVLWITGRVRLHYEGGSATSSPIDMEIHSEKSGDGT
jgi:hypothetical protein